ncbi:pentapeptide repeat-containing protein [Campylobacter coli]|uniref:pentapeptide repeat-containing protein n=1 Tax=Campylobacter coli TaxID=195 RepID=UPI0011A81066|nr:pentapeptide repeat-containing protein [Campylobacter coli]
MEELEQFGILAKNGKQDIKDDKITIINAEIKGINFQKLQAEGIKEICIFRSEIKYLYFLEKNTIKIDFRNCNFKNQMIARELYFKNEVIFQQCIFDAVVDFSKAKFDSKIDFSLSVFKSEVRFIEIQFLAEQNNSQIIENDFREVIFEGRASFSNATFKARVSFRISQFKDEARFTKTEFQANRSDSGIIENQFLGVVFAGKTIFDDAKFQARVSFGISQFKEEVRFIGTQFLAKQSSNLEIIENEFKEAIFKGKVIFDSLVFKARISFLFSTFKDEALFLNINPNNFIFHNVEFNKINFIHIDDINAEFNAESYVFQNTVFKDALSFEGMEFERLEFDNVLFNGVVTFSNTKFNTKPQFINCTFSNQFNIEHQYIKYSDKDIENKINNIQDKNDKFQALLNLRDLFRKLKSNRIAHHNLIDASELRTQELYARELELKYKKNKSLRETIEQWQLFFYRRLCDHHTDLLLNAKWLLYIVALYVLLLGKMIWVYPILIIIFLASIYLCKIKNIWLSLSSVTVLMAIVYCPKMIFGFTNLFTSNLNYWQNLITTVYVVVIGLVLFSLQKTARKNSIVPS